MNASAPRKARILLTASLLALLVGLGGLFWRAERRQATRTALENVVLALAEEAEFDRRLLERGLDEMRAHAHFFAGLPAVGDASAETGQESVRKQRLQQVFSTAIRHGDDVAQMSYVVIPGGAREWVRVERNPGDRQPRVAGASELKAPTAQELAPAAALPPDGLHLSLRQGNPAGDLAGPQLRFLKPVRNAGGELAGVLTMDRDLDPLLGQLGEPVSSPGASRHETYVTDLSGRYLLHPQHPNARASGLPPPGAQWDNDFKRVDDPAARLGSPLPNGLQAWSTRDGRLWLARMDELPLTGAADTDTLRLWQLIPWTSVQSTLSMALADRLKLGAAMGGLLAAGLMIAFTVLRRIGGGRPADEGPAEPPIARLERRSARQAALFATLVALLAGGGALFLMGRMDAELARSQAESVATIAIERVVDALDDSEHLVEALRQLPLGDITTQEDFARRAAGLARKPGPGVVLQWSPGGVVRYSFPLAGNESAIGHDLRADARTRQLLEASIQSGQARWDGPFELRQGGLGMVLRLPVHREGVPVTEASFTGVATSLVNLSLVMRRLSAERPDHDLRAWVANGDGPLTQVWGHTGQPAGEVRISRAVVSIGGSGLRVEMAAWPRETAAGWQLVTRAMGLGLAAGLLGALAFALESWRSGLRALGRESLKNQVLLQTASDGIHILDDQGNLLQFSENFARMLGYPGEELRHLNVQDWDTSAAQAGYGQLLNRLAGAAEGVQYDSRYRRKDGSMIEVEIACRLVSIEGRRRFCGAARDVSQRKQAEAALRRSEEQFRMLVEFAPIGKVMVNAEGRICMVNAQLERDSGYARQELLGQPVEVLVPVSHVQAHAAHRQRYAHSPEVRPMGAGRDLCMRRKDGSEFPAEIALTPIETSLGRLVVASIQNITPRRAAEAALLGARRRTELAVAAAKVGIWEWNLATDQVRWDARMFELYGLPPSADGFVAQSVWRTAVLPEELAAQTALVQAVASGELPEGRREFRIRRSGDAALRQLASVETLLRDSAGKPAWVLGTNMDVTEVRAAEAARLQQIRTLECVGKLNAAFRRVNNREGALEAALDEIAGMIQSGTVFLLAPADPSAVEWGVTAHSASDRLRRRALHGLKVTMTPGAAAVFRQIHGANEPIAFGPAEPTPVPPAVAEALQGEAGLAIALRPPGAPPWILWLNHDGASGRWDAEARWLLSALARRMEDLLAAWLSAQEIMRLNTELEQRVDARSMELEVTNEILKRSNEDLAQFASIASHDLKSPLRAIDTLAGWISEDLGENQSAAIRENLRLMRQRVRRMERLLDDLLAYSRAGKVRDAVRPVQIREMVDEITALIEVPPGLQVQLLGRPEAFTTAVTPLRTVLQNLINNAVKHHDRKSGTIEISVHEQGDFYEFHVEDDGPGIPPEHHERIWGMFQTLQPRDKVEGSGIGLALVKRLVQHYGGVVGVQNREPRGARFSFTWPKTIAHASQAG